jgi:polyisoprenoid-binding protein YceI
MALKHWKIDPAHSSISFQVRHMLVSKVHGQLTRWSGAIDFSEAVPRAGAVTVVIDASSIDTQVPERDKHLRSSDFLDIREHPYIVFESALIEPIALRQLHVIGSLTLRGITREVVLEVEYGGRMRDQVGIERIGFSARTTISRKAFGIDFNESLPSGGLIVGDKIEIAIDVEAAAEIASDTSHSAAA